jgi:hypothetical protein
MRDPVTTTSCSVGSGAAVAAGACCAIAGVDMAAAPALITKAIMNRFMSEIVLFSFRNLIFCPSK